MNSYENSTKLQDCLLKEIKKYCDYDPVKDIWFYKDFMFIKNNTNNYEVKTMKGDRVFFSYNGVYGTFTADIAVIVDYFYDLDKTLPEIFKKIHMYY